MMNIILSLQDDVQSPPSFKPPPPPGGVQRRPTRREQVNKCPSSESSHSGLYFTAPASRGRGKAPGHAPREPSREQAVARKRDPPQRDPPVPPKRDQTTAAQLSSVSQHHIGPFPRVRSPKAVAAPSPSPPPPLPAPPPPPPSLPLNTVSISKAPLASPGSKQQFVTVEVHRPNAEPDFNEVRPLPQTRGEGGGGGSQMCQGRRFVLIWVLKLTTCTCMTAAHSNE